MSSIYLCLNVDYQVQTDSISANNHDIFRPDAEALLLTSDSSNLIYVFLILAI